MSDTLRPSSEPTLAELAAELASLRERIEDLEDSHDLDAAIARNGAAPLVAWDDAKRRLGL